jgi:O-Antigen ligase
VLACDLLKFDCRFNCEAGVLSKGSVTYARAGSEAIEGAMTLLLSSLMALIAIQLVMALPMSLGPGLSAENALLYVVAGTLALKMAVHRDFRVELGVLHVAFAVLIIYAAASIWFVVTLVGFPHYRALDAVIALKSQLVDQFVFFAVFFYGVRNSRSALIVLKVLLVMTIAVNFVALLDTWSIIEAPGLVDREDGRIQGVMGESNQSAAFIACFLPALMTLALLSRGLRRIAWLIGIMICVGAMLISASRGALVSLLAAGVWSAFAFRRYFSGRTIAAVVGTAFAVFAIVISVITVRFGGLLLTRFVADSSDTDIVSVSSGRLDIWSGALAKMAEAPLTFITGYGWQVYHSMPFRFAPHNHYLALWFDLGLVGLICGATLLVLVIRTAVRSVAIAPQAYGPILIAFAIGAVALCVATFFVDLYTPWLWFWAFAGLTMRIAVNARNAHQQRIDAATQPRAAGTKNAFGWIGAPVRGA